MASKTWRVRVALAALAAAVLLGFVRVDARQPERIVAVGDIHGALGPFTTILRRTGLVDGSNKWSGGKAILVQTGDYTDRGAEVRGVMDLLMALEDQSRRAGGRALVLVGNHEVMNMLGELRDVGVASYATFADGRSESKRAAAYDEMTGLAERRAAEKREPLPFLTEPREAWMAAHPPGWLEYQDAFGPKGTYGAWLRRKPIFAKVGGTLFMHAGLNPTTVPTPRVEDLDQSVKAEIQRMDRFRQRLVAAKLALPFFTLNEVVQVAAAEIRAADTLITEAKANGTAPDLSKIDVDLVREALDVLKIAEWDLLAEQGPLWYRGYALAPEADLEAPLAATLERNNLTRMVFAHTPQRDGNVQARWGGRVLLIDTGMLAEVYKGRPSAVEIRGGQVKAIYPQEERALPSPAAKPGG